jgi:hypothetical protein
MQMTNLCAFSLMTAGLMAVALVSPAVAEDNTPVDVSATARVFSMPSPTVAAVPDTGGGGLAATNVSVGLETHNLPCVDCVHGAGTPNIGLPFPVFSVSQGAVLTVSDLFEATSYTGPCTAAFVLKQNDSVVAKGSFPITNGCQAGMLYGVSFNVPVPTTTGPTTVIGWVSGSPNIKSGAIAFIKVN